MKQVPVYLNWYTSLPPKFLNLQTRWYGFRTFSGNRFRAASNYVGKANNGPAYALNHTRQTQCIWHDSECTTFVRKTLGGTQSIDSHKHVQVGTITENTVALLELGLNPSRPLNYSFLSKLVWICFASTLMFESLVRNHHQKNVDFFFSSGGW